MHAYEEKLEAQCSRDMCESRCMGLRWQDPSQLERGYGSHYRLLSDLYGVENGDEEKYEVGSECAYGWWIVVGYLWH